jgi:DNA polymerase-3 subunit epsilon
MTSFVAIDFETANHSRDSACAVGLTACSGGRVDASRQFLIRPPTREFVFTYIHGLDWEDVRDAPTFGDLWPTLRPYLQDADFLVAHNAPFDRGVLRACCDSYGVDVPETPFECTVRIARSVWGIYPTKLPDVCARLDIPLRHHDAGSDAEACARIALAARPQGWAR